MALFGKLFGTEERGTKKVGNSLPWTNLDNMGQLDEIALNSNHKAQLIFKHSTTCGISSMVLRMITNAWNFEEGQVDLFFLDLHAHRDISNEVAHKFQVMHQSPQLIIIKNGVTVYHNSHGAITGVNVKEYL